MARLPNLVSKPLVGRWGMAAATESQLAFGACHVPGCGLLPAHPAGSLSSGSFRPVAAHGNNPTRPPFCPHSNARRSEAVFRWSPTHFRYVDCGATVGVAKQSRRLLVNSHLGANDVLIVLSANRVINKPNLCPGNHIPHLLHHLRQRRRHAKCRRSSGQLPSRARR